MNIEDAARECGMTVEEFFEQMVNDGLLLQTGPDAYTPTGHPSLYER